ncbi:PIN domain-containing protein [Haloplanus rubicundus]|uniref:Type II toxin-antitoxin system VapC family toxin n=1 Tax=Haloplanus rubicundus TaxID=1547898 RepID=A0A345EAE6_9EURY|nr:PIN domain-containing protein [Haloplanus rubicundus]AXG09168.1 type II toxin-antitoxin system VapC family toxin [Haloplanus rubicundus]
MRVVDTTFLVDYLDGHDAVRDYLGAHPDVYVTPAPAFTEVLQGEVYKSDRSTVDVPGARDALEFVDVVGVDERLAVAAAEFAGEVFPPGPKMGAVDALVGALARREGATVVTNDADLTHSETQAVVAVDAYRE